MEDKPLTNNLGEELQEPSFEPPIEQIETPAEQPEVEPGPVNEEKMQKFADAANRIVAIENTEPSKNDEDEGYDSEGYDKNGFNREGINKNTGTEYDEEGYDKDGFDDIGVDREGFDREGFGTDERDREGYDREGFNEKGIDREGYDRDGFDKRGYDREGFDREGFGRFSHRDREGYDRAGFDRSGYDREGYDEHGFDRRSFNREGICRWTGTEYNRQGWDAAGNNKDTVTGYDIDGYDERGLDADGFNRKGFNSQGINKETGTKYDREGYGEDGFDKKGKDREGYNRSGYDAEGYSRRGYDRNGFDREGKNIETGDYYDKRGFDKDGRFALTGDIYSPTGFDRHGKHKDTGTKFSPDGYNMYGMSRDGYDRAGFKLRRISEGFYEQVSDYNKEGIDREGFNKRGYDAEGYDRAGYDAEGYDRDGLDKDGYTREYNAKFNKYGVDENGYMKNGELEPDVAFAVAFAESGIKDQKEYAKSVGVTIEEAREKIESARKKCANIDEIIRDVLLTGNRMRMAAVVKECEKCIVGDTTVKEFMDKHPRLDAYTVVEGFLKDYDKKKEFCDKVIDEVDVSTENIEDTIRLFSTSRFDVPAAIKGMEEFKKEYVRTKTDGSDEQIRKKQKNVKKLYGSIKAMGYYKSHNYNSLLTMQISKDDGKTWIKFSGELVGQAIDALKKEGRLICVQTVKDYIINHTDGEEDEGLTNLLDKK